MSSVKLLAHGTLLVVAVAVILDHFKTAIRTDQHFQTAHITFDGVSRNLNILTRSNILSANIGNHLSQNFVDSTFGKEGNSSCFTWETDSKLCITPLQHAGEENHCYELSWNSINSGDTSSNPKDCFAFSNGHWYGASEAFRQHWPLSKLSFPMQPYISRDIIGNQQQQVYGSISERYFLNSAGIAIVVDPDSSLWVSITEDNDDRICLMAKHSDSGCHGKQTKAASLKYSICISENVKTVHKHVMETYFSKPTGVPDTRMFTQPIWSTWAKYKQFINESTVLEFAEEIVGQKFPNSQLEIDDKWSTEYGDLTFDPAKFPKPKTMIRKLHSMGFRVTIWTTPFANVESKILRKSLNFCWMNGDEELARSEELRSYFVHSTYNDAPALVKWWSGYGALIDFTNPDATKWYLDRHEKMKENYGIDSFKFDAGEIDYFPEHSKTNVRLEHDMEFSKYYAEAVSKIGGMVEVRSGYRTQHLPIFIRMMDKDSVWGYENGLKTLIPTCLTLGIAGYPFILPDMIGGNVYYGQPLPERELYIRWLEVTAFMPAMQFSIAPWQYDKEVVSIAHKYVKLHESYVTPIILRFAELSTQKHGEPIIRPIWWIDPNDKTAFGIDDEFLIGDEILVAPALEKGARKRDVYLPGNGNITWKHWKTEKVYGGRKWVKGVAVPLDEIACFITNQI